MSGRYEAINNEYARKIVHEYNVFMKETRIKIDETRRATMISLKKLLKLKDRDVIEIQEDDTLKIISAEEILNTFGNPPALPGDPKSLTFQGI